LLISFLIFTFLAHSAFADGSSGHWTWTDQRVGAGLAPDRLFAYGQYALDEAPWMVSTSFLASPSLGGAYFAVYYKPREFFVNDFFVGREQGYHSIRGSGYIPLATPQESSFSRLDLQNADQGRSAGIWLGGYHFRLYWSTLHLFPKVFEGLLSFTSEVQWMDADFPTDFAFDPAKAAVVGRREWIQDLVFFGGWRVNPEKSNATRVGLFAQTTWFQTNGARIFYVGPAFQSQAQNSPWDFYAQVPFKLENPYDERSVGVFVTIAYKN